MKLPRWVLHEPWASLGIWAVGVAIGIVAFIAGDETWTIVGLAVALCCLPAVVAEKRLHVRLREAEPRRVLRGVQTGLAMAMLAGAAFGFAAAVAGHLALTYVGLAVTMLSALGTLALRRLPPADSPEATP